MKRIITACVLFYFLLKVACAQNTQVHVVVSKPAKYTGAVFISDPASKYDATSRGLNNINLDNNGSGFCAIGLSEPKYVWLDFNHAFFYVLYISPGDNLTIKIDLSLKKPLLTVTGKGSNNNQPEMMKLTDVFAYDHNKDISPTQLMANINQQQQLNKRMFSAYITKYKPSADFIRNSRINMDYYAATSFFLFKTNFMGHRPHFEVWDKIQDSLFSTIKLNNDKALTAFNYTQLITFVLLRRKEAAWGESMDKPKKFYKDWYHVTDDSSANNSPGKLLPVNYTGATGDVIPEKSEKESALAKAKKQFENERTSLFIEKVLNKNFSGKTAEYLYMNQLKMNLYQSNPEHIDILYNHFKTRYPNSQYLSWFTQPVAEIVSKRVRKLTSKMIFVADNGSKLNSLKDLLALVKGKTVLLDMWGTWCSPCRQDIEKNSAELHNYFKGKDVTFMYVANMDTRHEQAWKNLIAYFQIEGTHILANERLTKDIMDKTKSTGFPSYIIINKDGTYGMAKSQYPMDRQLMINELDAASKTHDDVFKAGIGK